MKWGGTLMKWGGSLMKRGGSLIKWGGSLIKGGRGLIKRGGSLIKPPATIADELVKGHLFRRIWLILHPIIFIFSIIHIFPTINAVLDIKIPYPIMKFNYWLSFTKVGAEDGCVLIVMDL